MKMKNEKVAKMMATKVNEFTTIANCKEFGACKFGYGFVAKSTPKFIAPKATAAMWAAEFGTEMPVITKVTKVTNARSGNYSNKVEKAGASGFTADALNGYDWVVPNMIKRAKKDGSLQLTITYTENDKTSFVSEYVIDGERFATPAELNFIKSRLYSAPKSQKQMAAGVAVADIVNVRNYKFSNIVAIGKTPDIETYWESLTK